MNDLTPVLILVPLIIVIGGFCLGLAKANHTFQLRALAYRERLAAIERGLDPAQLPALPGAEALSPTADRGATSSFWFTFGIMALFVGVGIAIFIRLMAPHDNAWMIGIVPVFSGLGSLACGVFLDRRHGRR